MSIPASILVYGRDLLLLETRRMLLERTYRRVYIASEREQAQEIIRVERPDLLVLCYTLSSEDRKVITAAASALHPDMKVLLLQADGPVGKQTSGDTFNIFSGPAAFKGKVEKMLIGQHAM
jgi:DNA-binding response OmpR family regulator